MIVGLDHVVILVRDLEAASSDYASLGFTVAPGGEHADGLSHNSLIVFEDGAYIELIAFRGPVPQTHIFYRPHGHEGIVTYALLPSDIAHDVEAVRQRGLALNGPSEGGRLRPDGQQLAWQTATPLTDDLPFLCADVTPRDLRVPTGEVRKHRNGAIVITRVTVVVSNAPLAVERYEALLGVGPVPGSMAAFQVGETTIALAKPEDDEMRDYMAQRGDGLYSLSLRAIEGIPGYLDPSRTHGARIEIVSSA